MLRVYNLNRVQVKYESTDFTETEIRTYLEKSKEKIPNLTSITFRLEGDRVACDYVAHSVPFERIRRITGYLTGTTDSWNDAKRAEESERVKHSIDS